MTEKSLPSRAPDVYGAAMRRHAQGKAPREARDARRSVDVRTRELIRSSVVGGGLAGLQRWARRSGGRPILTVSHHPLRPTEVARAPFGPARGLDAGVERNPTLRDTSREGRLTVDVRGDVRGGVGGAGAGVVGRVGVVDDASRARPRTLGEEPVKSPKVRDFLKRPGIPAPVCWASRRARAFAVGRLRTRPALAPVARDRSLVFPRCASSRTGLVELRPRRRVPCRKRGDTPSAITRASARSQRAARANDPQGSSVRRRAP